MNYLIVNADDFGYSYGINRGIIEAHTKGIVTSTSVIVDAIAAEEAKGLTTFPGLSVGLHLVVQDLGRVQEELDRQLERFKELVGTEPDHIDVHKMLRRDERLEKVLREYARQHNMPIRQMGFAKFIDSFFGFHSNGDVSIAQLKKAIDQATDSYNELMCHVGHSDDYLRRHSSYSDMREEELKTICSTEAREYVAECGLILCDWKQVAQQEAQA